MCHFVQARSSLLTYIVFYMELSCPHLPRQSWRNGPNVTSKSPWQERLSLGQDTSAVGAKMLVTGLALRFLVLCCCCCCFSVFNHHGLLLSSPSQHISEWSWRNPSDIQVCFNHPRSAEPQQGEKWIHPLAYPQGEKEAVKGSWGISLVRGRFLQSHFQGQLGFEKRSLLPLGIWKENFELLIARP